MKILTKGFLIKVQKNPAGKRENRVTSFANSNLILKLKNS